jgi:hypothetical protein
MGGFCAFPGGLTIAQSVIFREKAPRQKGARPYLSGAFFVQTRLIANTNYKSRRLQGPGPRHRGTIAAHR